ncbi:MAG: SGNH/GDSL hydrolase family protein [Clostridiales bacterium]|nr:SGNH/GDSL hydrolase family protein [Clostridiales bacterium]
MQLKDGDRILFNGDSLTDAGRDRGDFHSLSGYNKIIADALAAFCPEKKIEAFNRGVGADKVRHLLARIGQEVEELRPTAVSLLIGINDVWQTADGRDPITAEEFERQYRAVLDECKKTADRIVIIEPFTIQPFAIGTRMRPQLAAVNTVIRKLAAEYKTEFIPADGIFAELSVKNGGALYSREDGVHLTAAGNAALAREWLKRVF